jgi:hypothetical protein
VVLREGRKRETGRVLLGGEADSTGTPGLDGRADGGMDLVVRMGGQARRGPTMADGKVEDGWGWEKVDGVWMDGRMVDGRSGWQDMGTSGGSGQVGSGHISRAFHLTVSVSGR